MCSSDLEAARQVGGGRPLVHDVPLADAGALQDPLVGGLDHLLQVGVGQQARRDASPERGDLRSWQMIAPVTRPLFSTTQPGKTNSQAGSAERGSGKRKPGTGTPAAHALARYRCFLPDLAGLAGLRRAGPNA